MSPRSTGRRRGERRRHPFAIGVFVLVALGLITYFAFSKRVPFVHGYRLHVMFSSSNQLRGGSPVRIAGVDVGKVVQIQQGPGTTADVTVELDDSAKPIESDATAKIRPRLFLEGGFYIQLDPGTPAGHELPDGGHIPLPQTSVPVQFQQLLSTLDRPTRDSLRSVVSETSSALYRGGAKSLHDLAPIATPALRDLALLTQSAQGEELHDVSHTIEAGDKLARAVADRDQQLADLVTGVNRLMGTTAAHDTGLRATVRETDLLLREAPARLRDLAASLPAVRRFTRAVTPGLRIAPPVLNATADALVQLRALSQPGELPRLLSVLAPATARLPGLVSRLRGLFPLVTPVTECVRQKALPVLYAKLQDGALSTGRPVWQDLAHSLTGLTSATQEFDANGAWVRYLAGGGEDTLSTGNLPGVGQLIGQTSGPLIGYRPRWLGPGRTPAFRPDQPCVRQAAVNLGARGGTASSP